MKCVSVVIPVFNEEKNIPVLYERIARVFADSLSNYACEMIFVDDASRDRGLEVIKRLAERDERVSYLSFSKNFSKEAATTAGIHHARGDAVMMIDADLQHPPELIPELVRKWEEGADVVVGVRNVNSDEALVSRAVSACYYWFINKIGDTAIVPNATDFRLLDRSVADAFNRLTERHRMTRGLIDWLGFKRAYVPFDAPKRLNGFQRYDARKRMKLAVAGIISHSVWPLKLAGWLGWVITTVAFLMGAFIFTERFILGDPWEMRFSGPAILAVILLFLVGVILICMGFIALYIGTIKTEISGRPLYVIREKKLKS